MNIALKPVMSVVLLVGCTATAPQPLARSAEPSGIAAPSAPGSTTPAVGASPVADPTASAAGAAAGAVRFVDPAHGWIGVADGILGTNDGGLSWFRELTAARITRIWSYDARRAWALAADTTVYRTRDGSHWTAIPPTSPPIADIDPFSPDVLWAIGVSQASGPQPAPQTGNVLTSDDGGFIWRAIGTHTMWSVCFSSRVDGFGAEGRQIFRTADGGRTWAAIATLPVNDQGPWYPTVTCTRTASFRVQVTEPYAALSHVPYLVFRTVDGGRSWDLEYREGYTLGTTTPQSTPALGSYPSIVGVLPDGNTWFVTCSPPADVQDFLVLDPAGSPLAKEKVPFVACARDASFIDGQHGWAIDIDYQLAGTQLGSQPRVLRTTDGARTWSRVYP